MICPVCGNRIQGSSQYCSTRCRGKAFYRAKKQYPIQNPPEQPCPVCLQIFAPVKYQQKFCSDTCRSNYHYRKRRNIPIQNPIVHCAICQKIIPYAGHDDKYCSSDCSRLARNYRSNISQKRNGK